MPRKSRQTSGTGIYHVMLRGINRQDIFDDPDDYHTFIRILSEVGGRNQPTCHIYAYCLMTNHVHLLLAEKSWTVGQVVKSIAASYVFHYNKKYGRVGHLFQDRFRSEPCNDPGYFLTLFRYIHQNPVKAGLVAHAQDYPYSSWPNDYLANHGDRLLDWAHPYQEPVPKICLTLAAIRRFGFDELAAWVSEPLPSDTACIDIDERRPVADEEVRSLLLQKSGARSTTDFQLLTRERQCQIAFDVMTALGAGPRQMSRISGLSYTTIYNMLK